MIRSALVAVALTVTACSGSSPHPPAASSVSLSTRDAVYLSVMRKHFAPAHVSSSVLLGARRQVCAQFRDGRSWVAMVAIMVKQIGMSGGDAGFAIAAAVRTGCPQFLALLPPG